MGVRTQVSEGSLGDLLDDFGSLLDTEWRLIAAGFIFLISFVYTCLAMTYMAFTRGPVSMWVKVGTGSFAFTLLLSSIYLIDPRPRQWLNTLASIEHTAWSFSLGEYRMRLRRWWRWRKKYEVQCATKLNV